MIKVEYPVTAKGDTVDTYFGTRIPDPYRWLEDDNAEATKNWVTAQNKATFGYLEQIPFREEIKKRLEGIWNYPKYSAPFKEGGYYFFYKNDGMQNQSVLYYQKELDDKPEVLIDPNKLSKDGTVALSNVSVSKNGKYVVYGTSKGGSDWQEYFVMDLATKNLLSDHLEWIKFSGISWKENGFYYSRYDAPGKGKELSNKNEFMKVYYHRIGTPQSSDELVYADPVNPQRNFYAGTTEDERFLVLSVSEGTGSKNALYYKDLSKPAKDFLPLISNYEDMYSVIDNMEGKLLVMTNKDAPKNQVVLIDPLYPDVWTTILPEKDEVLESVTLVGGKMIAVYMKSASHKVYVYDYNGKLENEIKLPTYGTVSGFAGKRDDSETFFTFTSFTWPQAIYHYEVKENKQQLYKKSELSFDMEGYETRQVEVTSKDGTKIPMFIVHKKGLELNGKNPTMLYGYGGFNISLNPNFSLSRLILLENGGVFAMPNLRGGGEFGEEWHTGGTLHNKQNVFDDFIAAAEYLIKEKYTSPEKLAISGGSNGGLLVGAAMTQRPELFKVALPAVGVLDMLRYHKFTIGYAWAEDYGTSAEEPHFKNLLAYSPLHNLKSGVNYPATLVTTGDHDDRVVPAHSFKFIATLQEKHKGTNPVLIRIETRGGHGAGKPTTMLIEEAADIYSFMFYNLGVTPKY